MLLVELNGSNEVPIHAAVICISLSFTYRFPTLSLAEEVHSGTYIP